MVIILALAWGLCFVFRYGQTRNVIRATMDASVGFGGASVLGCELLSLFSAYTPLWLSAFWLTLCVGMVAAWPKPLLGGVAALGRYKPSPLTWYRGITFAVIALCAGGALLAGLLYPPVNYDSLTYHMPRVLFWMKHASVHNYPTAIGRQLFTGPMTEFLIVQVQVLSMGSDRLANAVQWFAYLGAILAVRGIAEILGAGAKGRCLAALLAATTPMAILQASSTQSDLEMTFWCLITVYYAVLYLRGHIEKPGLGAWAVCTGGAAGLSLLTKLNALAVIGPFALLVLVRMIHRRVWRDLGIAAAWILACVLLINAGFFVRNAQDLHGDFLAYHLPESDALHVRTDDPRDYALLGVKTFSASMAGWPWNTINDGIDRLVGKAADWIGVPLNQENISEVPFMASMYHYRQSHDTRTNPVQAISSYVTLLALLGGALCRKKGRTFGAAYAFAVAATYGITALSMRWTTSIPRYFLPPLLLSYALIPLVFGPRRRMRGLACLGAAWVVLASAGPVIFNMKQPLLDMPRVSAWLSAETLPGYGRWQGSYEEMRAHSMGVAPEALAQILDQVSGAGAQRIGIDQSPLMAAIYPVLYAYRGAEFEIAYMHAAYLPERENPDFLPQAIFRTCPSSPEAMPDILIYREQHYKLTASAPAALGMLCLYIEIPSVQP